jgi:galactitol-specific phosphotransferase system IIC component
MFLPKRVQKKMMGREVTIGIDMVVASGLP